MKAFVINGSPKGERSDTLKVTKAFLEGLEAEYEILDISRHPIKECLGCHACWYRTPGSCIQDDDMRLILDGIRSADLVIWSFPLYCYGMPSQAKAAVDRLMPLSSPVQYVNAEGKTCHPTTKPLPARHMLISGCGFPQYEHNYEPLIMQFGLAFGSGFARIAALECPLLSVPEAKSLADGYLALARKAGQEFKENGAIAEDTQKALDGPMFDPDTYRRMASATARA